MVDNEAKGNQYLAEAQKKLKSSQGFLGGLLGFGPIFQICFAENSIVH